MNLIQTIKDKRAGKKYLRQHPLCPICMSNGIYRRATTVQKDDNGDMDVRCNLHRIPNYREYLKHGMPIEIYHRGGD